MSQWQDVGETAQFIEEEPRAVMVTGEPVAVVRLGDEFLAVHDICTHEVARLSEGFVEDGCIECPLHQGRLDVRSGPPTCAPITGPVRCYPVKIEAGRVWRALD